MAFWEEDQRVATYDDTTQAALAVNRRTYRAIRKRHRIVASRTIITEEDSLVAEASHG
jgi:hypothetical protein